MEKFVQRGLITFRTSTITTEGLKGGIQRFNGVATKYLNNYLAWFQVLESIQHKRNEVTMKGLKMKGNLIKNTETYDTLGVSKFTKQILFLFDKRARL